MKKTVSKNNEVLKIIITLLVIILISLISFVGIYIEKQGNYKNIVKDYSLGMNLKGNRKVIFYPDDTTDTVTKDENGEIVEDVTDEDEEQEGYTTEEIPVNDESVLTGENYKKSKDIIIKRLNEYNFNDYTIKQDLDTGYIILELDDRDNTETNEMISMISEQGKLEIKDSETEEILIDSSMVKDAKIMYNSTTSGTSIYLNIIFNKEGKEKLKQITTDYKTIEETETTIDVLTEDETYDEDEEINEEEQKEVTLEINGEEILSTSFDQVIENGSLPLTVGQASTDTDTIQSNVKSARKTAISITNGQMPIVYKSDVNKYYKANISVEYIKMALIITLIIIAIISIILIIKYKTKGFIAAILSIGFIAITLLIIRYANVDISVNGLFALPMILFINYLIEIAIINNSNKKAKERKKIINVFEKVVMAIFPILLVSIAFCFAETININSFGMILFWGIIITILYNLICVKLLDTDQKK